MTSLSTFYYTIDLLLLVYACYSWYWQASIQVRGPALFYNFVMNNMYFPNAKPNLIHEKIAQICNQKGDLITQNIDQLDEKAGG